MQNRLQRQASKDSETFKSLKSMQSQCYSDFLRSVSALAQTGKLKTQRGDADLLLLADSKARISIYGSKDVVEALANFQHFGDRLDTPESMSAFVSLCQKMRIENLSDRELVDSKDLSIILFGQG